MRSILRLSSFTRGRIAGSARGVSHHSRRWNSSLADVKTLTHIDPVSNLPRMVNVTSKSESQRIASAACFVELPPNVLAQLLQKEGNASEGQPQSAEVRTKKGPVISTAVIAATLAAKKTSELIPFCHHVPLYGCDVSITPESTGFRVESKVWTHHRTGVEMEALTAASVAALTIYDMCKALSHDIIIKDLRLLTKSGGKSDFDRARESS